MGKINPKIKTTALWVLGCFFLLMGIAGISIKNFFGPFLLIISGLITVPPSFDFINTKLKGKISRNFRIAVIVIFFILGIKYYQSTASSYNPPVNNVISEEKTEQVENKINSSVDPEVVIEKGTVVSVTDGDTIRVILNGNNVPVRLIGIDTPEISHPTEPVQCYGPEAKKALEELILNKEVVLEKDVSDKDKYDRYLRYIWLGEVMVNEYLTQNGFAFASPYPPDTKYQNRIDAGEQSAKTSLVGLWSKSTCNGDVYTGTYKDPNKTIVTPSQETNTPVYNTNSTYVDPIVSSTSETPDTTDGKYTCNCKKTCAQMSSCEEAQYQLNICGCNARDADKDGVACDSDCQ